MTESNKTIPIIFPQRELPVYNYSGNSYAFYSFNSSTYWGKTFSLFFKLTTTSYPQDLVYYISIGNESFELGTYPSLTDSGFFGVEPEPGEAWDIENVSTPGLSWTDWNLATFNITPSGVNFGLDGSPIFTYPINGQANQPVSIYTGHFGNYTWANDRFALNGEISALLASESSLPRTDSLIYISNSTIVWATTRIPFHNCCLQINYSEGRLSLFINSSLILSSPATIFDFGKLSFFRVPLLIEIPYFWIRNDASRSLLPNLFIENYILPFLCMARVFWPKGCRNVKAFTRRENTRRE